MYNKLLGGLWGYFGRFTILIAFLDPWVRAGDHSGAKEISDAEKAGVCKDFCK